MTNLETSNKTRTPARRNWIGALVVGLAVAVSGTALGAQTHARVKLATLAPKGSSFHQILQVMGEQWKQAPGGGVSLTIYTDGSMGGEADMVRKMRAGQINAAMVTASGLAEIDPSVTALQLIPLAFRNWAEVDFVREKLRPRLEQTLLEKGFVVLFWGDGGWVRFFSKKPVQLPDDLKKMKVFTTIGSAESVDIMKGMGLNPVPLEATDILPGLQTGLINAVPVPPIFANATQLFNQAPHMLDLNYVPLVGGVVLTATFWHKLSQESRAALLKAAAEAGEKVRTRIRRENEEAVEAMKKRGLTVHAITPESEVAWRQVAESVYPQIRGKIVPADMFDEVQRLLRDFRASTAPPK